LKKEKSNLADRVYICDLFAFLQEVSGFDLLSPVWLRPAASVDEISCKIDPISPPFQRQAASDMGVLSLLRPVCRDYPEPKADHSHGLIPKRRCGIRNLYRLSATRRMSVPAHEK
jgi:hypothetical protein